MAIPCTIDYTPYWADTGNNHAWPLALSATGIASDSSIHKAAKIYRKTFANHAENLMYHQAKGEVLPPWLNRPDYVDVTKQYLPTSDVTVSSKVKAPHAYLCVFNDGEWRPIQWARVVDKVATFAAMGRDILYLPVAFGKSGIVPAADPFILLKDGAIRSIVGSTCFPASYELTEKGGSVHAGKSYELFVWDSGWKSLGKQSARDDRVVKFTSVPSGYLYWLVEEGSRKEERPFTIDDGKQVWW